MTSHRAIPMSTLTVTEVITPAEVETITMAEMMISPVNKSQKQPPEHRAQRAVSFFRV